MNAYYPNLFKPLRVNSMMLKNRIISSIMGIPRSHQVISSTNYGNVSLYDKSVGGAAMVFVSIEASADEQGEFPKNDRDVIRESISVARQYGAKVGTWCVPRLKKDASESIRDHYDGKVVDAPSSYKTRNQSNAHELTKEEIAAIMKQCALDASAIKKFGFDFIYLYLGYEELPAQFLSPLFNQRKDEYGGSLQNRMRFAIEYIHTVREAVGKDFPIVALVGACDYLKGSYEFEDMLTLLDHVTNQIDLLNVSSGMDMIPGYFPENKDIDMNHGLESWYQVNGKHCQSIYEPTLTNVIWAKKIKQRFPNQLVSVIGSIMTPEDGEKLLKEGAVDAITMGRALNADPFLPNKAMLGKSEDIVPCIRCLYCYHSATNHTNVQCSVNPRYRRENRVPLHLPKAERVKTVVVIGGGPAGCVAAITAEQRGHNVLLFEKSNELGGQLRLAQYEQHKKQLTAYQKYLKTQLTKSSVKLHMNTEATPELIKKLAPDAVIIAIGAESRKLALPGMDRYPTYHALDIYPHLDKLKQHISIIGGGLVGTELAVELLERGKRVTLIEMGKDIASQAHILYKAGLRNTLNKYKNQLTIITQAVCTEIKEHGIIIHDCDGEKEIVTDDVVMACGLISKREESFSFYGIADETFMIGDCEKVGQIVHATNDAYFIASNL